MLAVRVTLVAFGLTLVGVVGCVKASNERPSAPAPISATLTAGEIAVSGAQDALRAIEATRPAWLAPGGGGLSNIDRVQIYVESTRLNDVSGLQRIGTSSIREIQFLDGREATRKFGGGHGAGAIVVRLNR